MLSPFTTSYHSRLPNSFQRLQQELNESLLDFRNGLMAAQGDLSLNAWKKDGEVWLQLELPGVDRDQVEIDVVKNRIHISANRPTPESQEGEILKSERSFGTIEREMEFPFTIDTAKTEAQLENGVLRMKVAAVAEEGPQRIEIKA